MGVALKNRDTKADDEESYHWWEDEELIAELDKRSADLKSGKDKGILWENAKKHILSAKN